jgi:hypothetical protein
MLDNVRSTAQDRVRTVGPVVSRAPRASDPATPGPAARKRPSSRVIRMRCIHCNRDFSRHAREGYTLRCSHCGKRNPGPELTEQLAASVAQRQADESGRRRATPAKKKAAAADPVREVVGTPQRRRAAIHGTATPPPSPPSRARGGTRSHQPAAAPADPTPPPRRGFLDRLVYGET